MSTKEVEILRAACCIAGLDGEICESEERLLRELQEQAGVGEASFGAMLERARTDDDYHKDVLNVLRADTERVMKIMIEVARADGDISINERAIIRHLGEKIGADLESLDDLLGSG